MEERKKIYGMLAEFATAEELVRAARQARADGWKRLDCYSPYPLKEAAEAIGFRKNGVARVTLFGGIFGFFSMFVFETWTSVWAYPMNIGGRPLFSWPAFIVPAFAWTIFCAGVAAAVGMLAMNGLPAFYHPLFNAENFCQGATTDKFFLCLEARDQKFVAAETRVYLERFRPLSVAEVEA